LSANKKVSGLKLTRMLVTTRIAANPH